MRGWREVMSLRILIFGDGENELGKIETEYATSGDLPALPRLIHRILGEPAKTTYTSKKFKKICMITISYIDLLLQYLSIPLGKNRH